MSTLIISGFLPIYNLTCYSIRETEARGTLQRLGYDSDDVYEWRTRGTRLILLMTAGL